MDWTYSVTGKLLSIQILRENDPTSLDFRTNPEAGENILALAQLVAWKSFAWLGETEERWQAWGEEATGEAALILTERVKYDYTPRLAYHFARQCCIRWVQRVVHGKLPRTEQELRDGRYTYAPPGFSLDGLEWEPLLAGEGADERYCTPEQILLAQEVRDERDICVERFHDVVYDLVVNRIQPPNKYAVALNDAGVLQMKLQGYTPGAMAPWLGCTPRDARRRLQRARQRLMVLLDGYGVGEVAGWYAGIATGEQVLPDGRTRAAFVRCYLAEREATYRQTRTTTPSAVQRKRWKRAAHEQWIREATEHVRGGRHARVAVAAD